MSEKNAIPDHIRIVKAVCVEFGNNDNTWGMVLSGREGGARQGKGASDEAGA